VQQAIETLPSDWVSIDEPCELIVNFYMPKPKTVTRLLPSVSPDLDKLIRAVGDALTDSGIVTDDSRIVRISARKLYAEGIQSGASILVKTLD
jgi:Holliday junction resolvase RusA-like endonuclease